MITYLKRFAAVMLVWGCSVYAVEIPVEEGLSVASLPNGVEIWLKRHESGSISCRVVAKNPLEEVPQIFSMNDCAADDFEESLPGFIKYCRGKIQKEAECKIGVIVVGDFEKESVEEFLVQSFKGFPRRQAPASRPISVAPSNSEMTHFSLSYPTSFQEVKTEQDLKKLWALYLLQSIVEERFRKNITDAQGEWIQSAKGRYLLPTSQCFSRGKQSIQRDPNALLLASLATVQEIKEKGFTELELSEAKGRLQKNLQSFYAQEPKNNILADYYASYCAFGSRCPSYPLFMKVSLQSVSEIERKDIAGLLGSYFKDEGRRVEIKIPPDVNITESSIQKTLDAFKTDALVLNLDENGGDSIEGRSSYAQLPITQEEKDTIYEIIDILGTKNEIVIGLNYRERMEKLGKRVQHVHPLVFLEVVFTNPHLKKCMEKARDSLLPFKWNGFMDGTDEAPGFVLKCQKEDARDNLLPYVIGFSQTVKANPNQVRAFIEKKEFEKLVKYLTKIE